MKTLYLFLISMCSIGIAGEKRGVTIEQSTKIDYKDIYTLIDLADAYRMERPFYIAGLHKIFIPFFVPMSEWSASDKKLGWLDPRESTTRSVSNLSIIVDKNGSMCVIPQNEMNQLYWCSTLEKRIQMWKNIYLYLQR